MGVKSYHFLFFVIIFYLLLLQMYRFIYNQGNRNNNNNKNIIRFQQQPKNQQQNGVPMRGEAKSISLFSQPYLDTYNQCYKNIVVVNLPPQGPLNSFVRRINFPPLSEFKQPGTCNKLKQCGYALMSLNTGCDNLMVVDEVPDLISYLMSNNYKVDTSVTKMFNTSDIRFDTNIGNKLICFVTYNPLLEKVEQNSLLRKV